MRERSPQSTFAPGGDDSDPIRPRVDNQRFAKPSFDFD